MGDAVAADANTSLGQLAVSWGGTEGALVYARMPASHVFLRRFDGAGHLLGTEVDLGTSAESGSPAVYVASNGAHHVACFEAGGVVAAFTCASVAVGTDTVAGSQSINGASPSVAHGAGGFLVVYVAGGMLMAQFVDGAAASIGAAAQIGGDTGMARLCGHSAGYGVTFTNVDGSLKAVNLTDSGFPTAALYTLAAAGHFPGGQPFGFVSVNGGYSAVWYDPAFSGGKVVSATVGPTPHAEMDIGGSTMTYGKVAAAAANNSIAATWSDFGGNFLYRALDSMGVPLAGSSNVPILAQNWDDNLGAVTAVADGFVFAGERGSTPGGSFNQIQLVHLGCP